MNCLVVGQEGRWSAALRAGLEGAGARVAWAPVADSREQAESSVAAASEATGELTVLIACPSDSTPVRFEELTPATFDATLASSFRSVFLYTQAALPRLRAVSHGRLVYVVSTLGIDARPRLAHVAAAEQAVIALMRTATLEVTPPLTANVVAFAEGGTAEGIVDPVQWLLRPESDNLTGQVLTVAGAAAPRA